jgi:hypothetical protein
VLVRGCFVWLRTSVLLLVFCFVVLCLGRGLYGGCAAAAVVFW